MGSMSAKDLMAVRLKKEEYDEGASIFSKARASQTSDLMEKS